MATKTQNLQTIIRYYKQETGETQINMHEVAKFAAGKGYKLPAPKNPLDLLAKELSQAAREEVRLDKVTGKPYRVNHAVPLRQGAMQLTLWVDIDEAPRNLIVKSLVNRREQMVGDAVQLTLDSQHWSRVNPGETAINLPLDFTEDVEWRLNSDDEEEMAA